MSALNPGLGKRPQMFPEQCSSIHLLEWITGDSPALQMWVQTLSMAWWLTLAGFRVRNYKMGIIPPPTAQRSPNGQEQKPWAYQETRHQRGGSLTKIRFSQSWKFSEDKESQIYRQQREKRDPTTRVKEKAPSGDKQGQSTVLGRRQVNYKKSFQKCQTQVIWKEMMKQHPC